MGHETFQGLAGVVAAFIVVGCIASIFGFTLRRPKASQPEVAAAAPQRAFEHEMATSQERPGVDHAKFRTLAGERLEPLLNALVDRARAHHYEARYEVLGEGEATTYRLEVKRPDHPVGQPLPYIAFSAGDDDLVEIVYGGVFPGPTDHNKLDPEIGWRTIRWDQVDDVIATFTHKIFAHFE